MKIMADMVRVNTRISKKLNDWLDKKSNETGVPKSTLIFLAIENYVQQHDAMDTMKDVTKVIDKIETLEQRLKAFENSKKSEEIGGT